jgi:CheY-like chemotaxis protein
MDNQPKLLLSIEDDQDDIALIEEAALEFDSSLRFVAKANGKEAMMFLHRQKEENNLPCLILLDINLPLMNGKEVLEALKNDSKFKEIPIVVFTTSSGQREKLLCDAFGVEMITKPNRVFEFKKVLSHLLVRCIV